MKKFSFIFVFCHLLALYCYSQNTKTDSLLTILKNSKEDTTKINVLNKLFVEYQYIDSQKAMKCLNQSLEIAKKINDKKSLIMTYRQFGLFAEENGNYNEALQNYFEQLKIAKVINENYFLADAYNNIGSIYCFKGNYPEALKTFLICLKIYEQTKNEKGIASSLNNIGTVYDFQDNYTESLKNHLASLKIEMKLGNKPEMASSYNNIGSIYLSLGKLEASLTNHLASLKLSTELMDSSGISTSYFNIAGVYNYLGKYAESLDYYFRSLKIREKIYDKVGIATCCGSIGDILIKQKKYHLAREYLQKSKELSTEIGYIEYLKDIYSSFSNLDSATGNFKGAYENHKLYILYSDSLDNEETRKKTIQTQMAYDFEKKEAIAVAEHKKELENQEALSEEKRGKQQTILYFVLGSLFLVLLFAGFIFRSLSITRKQKNIIELQKNKVEEQKQQVELQKHLVEEKQKEILDSIHYAKRIQHSQLPNEQYIEKALKRLNS